MFARSQKWIGLGAYVAVALAAGPVLAQTQLPTAPRPAAPPAAPAAAPKAAAPAAPTTGKLKVPVVAIVDAQTILNTSEAGKKALLQLDGIAAEWQKRIDADRTTLEAERTALDNEEKALGAKPTAAQSDALAKKRADWQKRFDTLQRSVDSARRELAGARDRMERYVQGVLVEVVGKLAEERGIDVVLPTSQILFASNALNLTSDTLARFNKRLTEVPININDGTKPPAAQAPAPAPAGR